MSEYVIGFVEIRRYQFENEFLTCYKYAITFASSAILQINTKFNHNAGCALHPRECSHGPVGATLHESGFEPVGAEERSYGNAA